MGPANLSVGKGRLGFNLGGSAVYSWPSTGDHNFFREDQVGGITRTLSQNGLSENSRLGFNGNGSLFYDINAYNSINSSFSTRGHNFDSESIVNSAFLDPGAELTESYRRTATGTRGWSGFEWNTDYLKKFQKEGQELIFAFQVNGNNSDHDSRVQPIQ